MTADDALTKILKCFEQYYDISRNNVLTPFSATAQFHLFSQQYFLVKQAKLGESDSHDYVYFYTSENFSAEDLERLDQLSWNDGLSKIHPCFGHRNSDVTLIVISDHISEEVFKAAKHHKHDVSYRFSFFGWSQFKLVCFELSSGRFACNRLGKDLRKLFRNIEKN